MKLQRVVLEMVDEEGQPPRRVVLEGGRIEIEREVVSGPVCTWETIPDAECDEYGLARMFYEAKRACGDATDAANGDGDGVDGWLAQFRAEERAAV